MRGTIKQRSKGSWTIILDLESDPATGRRRQRWETIRGSRRQAEQRLTELLRELDIGGFVKPASASIWCRPWAGFS